MPVIIFYQHPLRRNRISKGIAISEVIKAHPKFERESPKFLKELLTSFVLVKFSVPQLGHFSASLETSCPQTLHSTKSIFFYFYVQSWQTSLSF